MMLYKAGEAINKIKHDKEIQIATANTSEAANWRNQTILISDFIQKITSTVRTKENFDAYMALSRTQQNDIKDVGGFVGGMLKGGRRGKGNVANRSIMTFDIDYGDSNTVDAVRSVLGENAYTIYSTHKHKPNSPRLRVIVYTDRPMLPDEYQAAMRKIAEKINIDFFDGTTYQPNRMMYWPSTSADAEFYYEHNDAPFIVVDDILNEYDDWKDITQWPRGDREANVFSNGLKRQADPKTKKNIVGSFCRNVSIHDAIEMTKAYKRETDDRYTYIEGTSAKGLVVYQNLFAYSNHSTDPGCGMTLNAFDMIRVHLFAHLDDDAKEGTPTHKLPSYAAAGEYAKEIKAVRKDLISVGLNSDVAADFDVIEDDVKTSAELDVELESNDWFDSLQVTDKGIILTTFVNAIEIVRNDKHICSLMAINDLAGRIENKSNGELWGANDSYKVRKYIGAKYQVDFPENKIEQAIEMRQSFL